MNLLEAINSLWNARDALPTLEWALPNTRIKRRKLATQKASASPLHPGRFARICDTGYNVIEHAPVALIRATGDTPAADLRKHSDLQKYRTHKMAKKIQGEPRQEAQHILDRVAADTG